MQELAKIYGDTLLLDKKFNYCPGCGHGVVTRLVAEAIEELGIRQRTVSVVGIGCGGFSHHYMDIDAIEAMHGRSPAVAIGYKTASPDKIVYTYQGDGDCSAIGLAELLHGANRGLPVTCFMINNNLFGMTGGQMSPATLENQVTATTPKGRDVHVHGYPLRVPEMMADMVGAKYVAREAVCDAKSIRKAAKSVRNALQCQIQGLGFSFVEFIVPCPTGLKLSVPDAYKRSREKMVEYFKPQVFKNEVGQNNEN
jgi:2-oxoglutarate ferredoxin oxidoreductase subunit beta